MSSGAEASTAIAHRLSECYALVQPNVHCAKVLAIPGQLSTNLSVLLILLVPCAVSSWAGSEQYNSSIWDTVRRRRDWRPAEPGESEGRNQPQFRAKAGH